MGMRHSVYAACVTALFAAPAPAQNAQSGRWSYISQTQAGRAALDTTTVRRDGQRVTYWKRFDYNNVQSDGTATLLAQEQVDCVERTVVMIAWSAWDSRGGVIDSGTVPPSRRTVSTVTPESSGETFFRLVCRQ